MRRLSTVITDALRVGWQEVLPLKPEILRYETDARMAAIMAPNDVAIVCAFDIAGGIEGKIHRDHPLRLGRTGQGRPALSAAHEHGWRFAVRGGPGRRALTRRVEVRGVLGHANMSFEKLLDLNVGDLISLDADEKGVLPIYVQGRRSSADRPVSPAAAWR